MEFGESRLAALFVVIPEMLVFPRIFHIVDGVGRVFLGYIARSAPKNACFVWDF